MPRKSWRALQSSAGETREPPPPACARKGEPARRARQRQWGHRELPPWPSGAEHLDEDPKLFLQLPSADQLRAGDPGTQTESARNRVGDHGKQGVYLQGKYEEPGADGNQSH